MSLSGALSDFGMADIFQLIAQQRKTGVLKVENNERQILVYFLEGQVVRARPGETWPDGALASFLLRTGGLTEVELAEVRRIQEESLELLADIIVSEQLVSKDELESIAKLMSDEAIFELFLWDDGCFAFRPDSVEPMFGDLMVGAETVLLDALRMRDEWGQVVGVFPDLAAVLVQGVEVEDYRELRAAVEVRTGLSGAQLDRLFMSCDGRLTARHVIDLSRLGTFLGARGLLGLVRESALQMIHKAASRGRARQLVSRWEGWARGSWVLVVCCLISVGTFVVPAPAEWTYPIPNDALAQARVRSEQELLRSALEVYRWSLGKYPESIDFVLGSGVFHLAPHSIGRYSYVRSQGGYRLQEK